MANNASAKKRIRQNKTRRERNEQYRRKIARTLKALAKNAGKSTAEDVSSAQSILAKAAKTGVIKKRALARHQSRIMKAMSPKNSVK